MGDATPRYSDADFERAVAERVASIERDNIINALSKELAAVRREIASANHIKQTIGKQLAELASLLEQHIRMPMHPGAAEKFSDFDRSFSEAEEEFGLDSLTPEERAAFPVVVKTVLAGQKRVNEQKQLARESAEEETRLWQKIAVFATLAAVATSMLSATGFFIWFRVSVFHLPGGS